MKEWIYMCLQVYHMCALNVGVPVHVCQCMSEFYVCL